MSQPAVFNCKSVPAMTNSMSSGWAAMARAEGIRSGRGDFADFHRAIFGGRSVGGSDDAMGGEGLLHGSERHFLALLQRVEKRLELRLVGVIADVAAIEHLH